MKIFLFRCEFAIRNPNGCQSNQYYTAIEPIPSVPGAQLVTGRRGFSFFLMIMFDFLEAPTEPWKVFIQSREQFTCAGYLKIRKNKFKTFSFCRQTRWILCQSLV